MRVTALRSLVVPAVAAGALVWTAATGAAPERRVLDCTGPPEYVLLAMSVQRTSITLRLRIDTTGGAATATVDFLPVGDGAVASKDLDLPGSGVYTITSGPALSVRTGYTVEVDLRNLCDSTQAVFFTSTFPESDSPSVSVIRPAEGGRVTANVGHPIDCGDDCSAAAPVGTTVRLMAVAEAGYTVAGWDGAACGAAGPAAVCSFTLVADVAVGVRFVPQVAPAAPAAGAGNAGGGAPGGAGPAPSGGQAGGSTGAAAGGAGPSTPAGGRTTPAVKPLIAKKPVVKQPVVKKPVAKKPVAKKPVVKPPVAIKPAPLCVRGQRPTSARPCRPREPGAR